MNEDCKSSEKNNMNFIVQSLACMVSLHNILSSYADDSRFQSNQKIPSLNNFRCTSNNGRNNLKS